MAAAKEITLKVNIDPSGAVSGAQALEGTQKQILSAFTKNNAALKGLESAYKVGRDAVNKYNLEAQIAINLLGAHTKAGTAAAERVAKLTTENIRMLASIKELNAELSRKEAADRSAAASATASAQALGLGVSNLERLVAAYAGGRAAIEAFNREKYIEQTVFASMAGKTQAEIQAIANDAAKHWDLTAAVKALENGLRGKEAAMEAAHAAALADNAAMDLAKQKTDAFVVSIQNEVARLQGLAAAYNGGRAGIAAFNLAEEIKNRQMQHGVSATSAAGQAIEKFTRQEYAAREAVDKLEKELKAQEKATQQIKPTTDKATHGVNAFQVAVASLATVALNRLKNEIVGARQSFDRMTNTFAVSSGSAAEAAEKMSFLRGNAQRLGLDIQSVGVSFAKFDVAAQNTSLSSKQIRDIFVSVSEATTAMGLSSEVAEGAILALQQMISKGTVQSEELRGQFAERIPGAFRLAAEAMGWTQLELAKNLEQGRVLSEDLLPKLAAKLHEVFGPGSVSGSKLLSAEINRLKNEWFDFLVQTSQDIKLPQLIAVISENFSTLAFAAKAFLALGLIVYFPVLAEKVILLASSMKAAAVSANGFWTAMLGGEVGITAVITAIIIAGYELNKAINDWKTDSSTAMAGYVADGERVKVQLSSIRDLYVELNKLNPFNQEGGTPNVTADMLKAINEEVSKTEEKLRSDMQRMEQLKQKLGSGNINIAAGQYGAGQQDLEAEKKEYESLIGTTGVLSEKLKTLKERQFDAKQEMFNAAATSKVADDALKEYDKTVADISARYNKGLFAHLGGEDLSAAEQYAEYMRQLADARKAYDQAIAPGRAQVEAKEMRQQVKEANEYTKALDQLIKKYDEKRYAEEAAIAAHALVEDAYDKERLGAKGSEEALRNLNTVHEQVSATLQEKLHEGYGSVMADITKFNSETQDSIDVINRMVEAQTMSAEGLLEAERNEAIYGKTKDLVTKYKMLGLNATEKESQAERDYRETMEESIRVAQELAGIEFDRARSLGISENLRKTTEELEKAIVAQHEYNKIVAQGPAAVEEYAIQQEALAAAYAAGARTAEELKAATAILVPYLKTLKEETKDGLGKKMIDDLKYETEWMNKYAIALSKGAGAVEAFNIAKQVSDALRNNQVSKEGAIELEAALKESSLAKIRVQLAQITADFKEDMWGGLESSLNTFFQELGEGNKDALQNFGKSLTKVMLDAVAKWLASMLVAIAKAAIAAKSIQAGGGSFGSGGGNWMSALKSLFGGGAGASAYGAGFSSSGAALGPVAGGSAGWGGSLGTGTGAGGFGTGGAGTASTAGAGAGIWAAAFVAVLVGIAAIAKHQSDAENKRQYGTTSSFDINNGSVTASWHGKLNKTGPEIANAMKNLLDELQAATGLFILGVTKAEIAIRNDKKGFYLKINDAIVGQFKTAKEAMLAAVKTLFSQGELSGVLDKRVAAVINNFNGDDPKNLIEQVQAVQKIIDEVSGLSDIEIALRNLPGQTSALTGQLQQMGLTLNDATELAAQWQVKQYQNLRDQITGHQQTAAEQMAQKQREAAMFNAQLTLEKAKIAADIEALKAKIEIARGESTVDQAGLQMQAAVLGAKADLIQDEFKLENGRLVAFGEVNRLTAQALEKQLAALQIAQGYLDQVNLITPGEIHINGGSGGRGRGNSGGPDIIKAFWDFMKQQALDAMPPVARALAQLNEAFDAQVKAAQRLGKVEELEAARIAAIARMRDDFLRQYNDAGMTQYQRAVRDLNEAFDDQEVLNEYIGREAELDRVRHEAMMRLREDLLNSFGSPMESVRDNLEGIIQRFRDLDEANRALYDDMQNGTMTAEEYAAALEHSRQVQEEFNQQMAISLLGMAVYFTDAMGNEQKSAEIRAKLAEFEYNLKLAEFELTLETAYAQHWINTELYNYLKDILDQARENPPDFTVPQGGDSGGDNGTTRNPLEDMLQALLRALDRLRNILQTYTDFLMGLQTSELSPYSISDQYDMAQAEYERLLALAQSGDLNAMEQLPAAAQSYLDLAAQMFGTASAGYSNIFQSINDDMTAIMGDIQNILDQVPSQYQPIEQKLDTIAEILDNMYLLWMNFDTGTGGSGGGGGFHMPPTPTATPRTLEDVFGAYGLDWSQISGYEAQYIPGMVNSILADNQVSSDELASFVSALEGYLGMSPGSMTSAQISALSAWLYRQIGNTNLADPDSAGGSGGRNVATSNQNHPSLSHANGHAAKMNKTLELIADLTAKGIRESSADRNRKPKFGYAGYAGGNSASRRS